MSTTLIVVEHPICCETVLRKAYVLPMQADPGMKYITVDIFLFFFLNCFFITHADGT